MRGHARPLLDLKNRSVSSENVPACAREWTPVAHLSFPRNEGVPGSSPGVGFRKGTVSPGFRCRLLGSARLEGKRELKLVKHVAVFFLPGAGGRLQRVEELLLLLAMELEILTRRGKGAPASLDFDPIREVGNRLGDDGPALELRHQEGRSSLGHAPISIGEEEADGRHRPSISRSLSRFPRCTGRVSSGAVGGLLR
jgi:hypothetical protein